MSEDRRPVLGWRPRPAQWIAIDSVLALLLAVLLLASTAGRQPAYGIPDWIAVAWC